MARTKQTARRQQGGLPRFTEAAAAKYAQKEEAKRAPEDAATPQEPESHDSASSPTVAASRPANMDALCEAVVTEAAGNIVRVSHDEAAGDIVVSVKSVDAADAAWRKIRTAAAAAGVKVW